MNIILRLKEPTHERLVPDLVDLKTLHPFAGNCLVLDQNTSKMDLNCTPGAGYNSKSDVNGGSLSSWLVSWNIWTCVILGFTYFLLVEYKRRSALAGECSSLPPGRTGWPILGETIGFIMDGRQYFRSRLRLYGPIFRSHLMGQPAVVIIGAPYLRRVLSAPDTEVVQGLPPAARALFGDNALCTATGSCHRRLQRAVLRAFSHRNLANMTPAIQDIIRRHIHKWLNADIVTCCEAVRLMAFEISNETLLGFEFCDNEQKILMELFRNISDAFFSFPINLPGFAFYKGARARDKVMKMIAERQREVRRGGYSLLDHLGDDDIATKEEVSATALEVMFGGHETTASAICAGLITLSSQPDVMDKIREELRDYCIKNEAAMDNLGFEDIVSLKYAGDVVKELLRLKPPIAGVFRKTAKPIDIGSYRIPENYMVLCGITDTHEELRYFDKTTEFRCERWQELRDRQALNQSVSSKMTSGDPVDSFDYLPFGRGRRHCVGKELAKLVMKIFVLELAKNCEWTLLNGEPKVHTAPIPFPADGLPIKFRGRKL